MLFRKHIVSTRTLFQLTVAVLFFVAAVGAAVAATSGNPPLLVPYTTTTVAGTPQYDNAAGTAYAAGYKGDGGPAVPYASSGLGTPNAVVVPGAVLSSPAGQAIDSVGDVYIADTGNALIREVNYATGIINTIAGVTPTCSGSTCTAVSGCADGVPAYQGKIGKEIEGVAVDSFGNVYFMDESSDSASVVYRGGQRVADFIARVNPGGVARSGGTVQVGYVYHIGGEINLQTCVGTTSTSTGVTVDNALAFEDTSVAGAVPNAGATLHSDETITLDSAGNIYIDDSGSVRVINTQETAQTFFEYTVQPGYMRDIVNCSPSLTVPCPALQTLTVGTGTNGPANAAVFSNNDGAATADQYGNVYQMESRQGLAAYAGGAPLTNLLTVEAPYLSSVFSANETEYPVPVSDAPTPNELPLAYGNTYIQIGDPSITSALPSGYLNVIVVTNQRYASDRTYIAVDNMGTMYYEDNHFGAVSRIDQFTADGTWMIGTWAASSTGGRVYAGLSPGGLGTVTDANGTVSNYTSPATFANPWMCQWGSSSNGAWIQGPQSYDPVGDGCPGMLATINDAAIFGTNHDAFANLYIGDGSNDLIREMEVGTQFPPTPVETAATPYSSTSTYALNSVVSYLGANYISLSASNTGNTPGTSTNWSLASPTQAIQIHFDATNIPLSGGATSGSFTSVSVPNPTGLPLAYTTNSISITAGSDFSIDTTTPEFPIGFDWVTLGTLKYDAANGTKMWAGAPTCSQLNTSAPDSSWDCLVYVRFNPTQPGLRKGQLQVTTANGSQYTFMLTGTGTGGQLAIDGGQPALVATTGLGSATAVAVDPTGNVYIADPANNRVVVEPSGGGAQTSITSFTLTSPVFGQASVNNASLKGPMGVAVDGAGNVYISDTGNNRVLKVAPTTNPTTNVVTYTTATLLGQYLWVPGAACDGGAATTTAVVNCTYTGFVTPGSPAGTPAPTSILNDPGSSVTATVAPPQYQFKAPEGLAVDAWGNVYVADTGNAAVVEIPADTALGGATPLMQYTGAPTFTTPVGVAVDSKGFVYVADTGNAAGQIVRIPPGGGDLQPASNPTSALSVISALQPFDGQSVTTANGVAVDAAGNVYVSDSGTNTVVEAPAVLGANGVPFALSFNVPNSAISPTALSTPAGLALDPNGNLYVADSGNNRVLVMNRQNPVVPFGIVPQDLTYAPGVAGSGVAGTPAGCPVTGSSTPCTGVLTVTNIGNQPVTLTSPFLGAITNSQYTISSTCTSPIAAGTTCTISPVFTPTSDGAATDNVSVNGSQSIAMMGGTGANPEVNIALSTPTLTPAANSTPTITATVGQSHVMGSPVPTGTVTFNYVIDAGTANAGLCGAPGTSGPVTLNAGVATYIMPALGAGQTYTVSAVFTPGSSDTTDGITNATPIVLAVPAAATPTVSVTSTPAQLTYTYGATVPTIAGTVTPAPTGGVTYSFTSGASQFSPPGSYPIQVVFTGGGTAFCSYGFPEAYSGSTTTQATMTENQGQLQVVLGTYTTVYGAAPVNFGSGLTITGAEGNDIKELSAVYLPADSAVLDVGIYPVTATVTGKPISSADYGVTYAAPQLGPPGGPGSITVTPAPSVIAVTASSQTGANAALGLGAATYVAESAMTSTSFPISVSTQVPAGLGTPTGTVTVYDTFIPITTSAFVPTGTSGAIPLPCSATITVNCVPSGVPIITPCAAGAAASTSCTQPITVKLTAGAGTFSLPANVGGIPSPYYTSTGAVVPGTHYFIFLYGGDPLPAVSGGSDGKGDFECAVLGPASSIPAGTSCASNGTVATALIVDNPDYTLTSTTGVISIIPGNVPNGNGLPAQPNQNTASPQSAIIEIGGVLNFTGTLSLSCTPQYSYETCFTGQIVVANNTPELVNSVSVPITVSGKASETAPFVFDISTPATLPLGYNTTTAQLRTSAGRMVLAFLPLGFLAFCVRRRRRLSKALWMLIAIAAVSAGMSGCSGNQVAFYTPIPTGPQTVTVTASYPGNGSTLPAVSRTYVVSIIIN